MSITFFENQITPWACTPPKKDQNKHIQDKIKMGKYTNKLHDASKNMLIQASKSPYETNPDLLGPKDE